MSKLLGNYTVFVCKLYNLVYSKSQHKLSLKKKEEQDYIQYVLVAK